MTTDSQALPAATAGQEPVPGVLVFSELAKLLEDPGRLRWEPFHPGVYIHWLYRTENQGPSAALIRFEPGASVPLHEHRGHELIYIVAGAQSDENGQLTAGSLRLHPPGTRHSIVSEDGCLVLAVYERPPEFFGRNGTPPAGPREDRILLAINGTLMRGLELNPNLVGAGGTFVRETFTEPAYRLWSIGDRHPAMIRVRTGGVGVAVEVWSVPRAGLISILVNEPPGLGIGKVKLADGTEVLGVLGEPAVCEGQREITEFRGWRAYLARSGRESWRV